MEELTRLCNATFSESEKRPPLFPRNYLRFLEDMIKGFWDRLADEENDKEGVVESPKTAAGKSSAKIQFYIET